MGRKWILLITVTVLLIGMTAAFAYGKSSIESKNDKSYLDALNDYDWSNTCPGASCRNNNDNQGD